MNLFLVRTEGLGLEEWLSLEEGLLRGENQNFCLWNQGTPLSLVLGRSLSVRDWINLEKLKHHPIPVFRRLSSGGAVVVDENTIFVSFIFSKREFSSCPSTVFQWTEDLYKKSWSIASFALQERDYTIQDQKCGGNAAYFIKDRFLQHTSFLWDYSKENMSYLLPPPKSPMYRKNRLHSDFLCRMEPFLKDKNGCFQSFEKELSRRFDVQNISLESAKESFSKKAYRKALFRESGF
ncbi:MAG: lipoate--protein ligase family protein [Chlamydiota bacterium]